MNLLKYWQAAFNPSEFERWMDQKISFFGIKSRGNSILADDSDNYIRGGGRNDQLIAGKGIDFVDGRGGDDVLVGDRLPNQNDYNADGSIFASLSFNKDESDILIAGKGEDILINQFGSDYFSGDKGNDRIISLSDSGIPTGNNIPILDNNSTENQLSQLDFSTNNINPNGLAADDTLIGGKDADRFEFHLLINARKEIVDKYTDVETGIINWGMNGVAGENDNYHDHWVEGIGNDIILDFNSKEGDKILISGHTVQAILLENNETLNEALVGVYSDQGADGRRGNGAHDLDVLGTIKVFYKGSFDFDSDVNIQQKDYGAYGVDSNIAAEIESNDDVLLASTTARITGNASDNDLAGDSGENRIDGLSGDDKIVGYDGNDKLFGGSGADHLLGDRESRQSDFHEKGYFIADKQMSYDDKLIGGSEDDLLVDQYGADRYSGDAGNDRLVSLSDSSVPNDNKSLPAGVNDGSDIDKLVFANEYFNPVGISANDVLTGGEGADTFEWRLLINASKEIVDRNTDTSTGVINWGMNGVAGENDKYHDHWVDGIGIDTITDFSGNGGENDHILIQGHTVQALLLSSSDNSALIGVYSDQGADGERGNGAHDFDVLGVIRVNHDGNFSIKEDLSVNSADFGAYGPGSGLDDLWA